VWKCEHQRATDNNKHWHNGDRSVCHFQ
jgi:hypothetical protein